MGIPERHSPHIRRAREDDLPEVVRMFAIPDEGNRKDESPAQPLDPCYAAALRTMADDPNNGLYVAEVDGRVAGAFQLTFIQHVAYRGGLALQIENVIVDPTCRGRGVGDAMMRWAIDRARERRCFRVQLTSNKRRTRAHRFYERLGFVASHEGMKLALP
ncbi:MAG TPA: GNAT family N-acetyltransferase [Polyangiaceae bacterium]